jgi:hypothetical protein
MGAYSLTAKQELERIDSIAKLNKHITQSLKNL